MDPRVFQGQSSQFQIKDESQSAQYPPLQEDVKVGDMEVDEVEGEGEGEGEEEVENEHVGGEGESIPPMEGLQKEFIPEESEEIKPKVGMKFVSEDEAYEFYNAYAKWCGFSLRKGNVSKLKSGERSMRIFTCSKEGYQTQTWLDKTDQKTRCGCLARVKINRKKGSTKWVITMFNEVHSHNLMNPSKSHSLRSQSSVPDSLLDLMEDSHAVGVGVVRNLNYSTNEVSERECLGYGEIDARNALQRKRFEQYGRSAQHLLQFFKRKSKEDSKFSYEIQVDDDCRVTSYFWIDGTSKIDYDAFGDVVCFDTTYKTNKFDMPFGLFVGVNHHYQSILLGAGLLFGESIDNFKWLFQTWLETLGGRFPGVIITDHDPAIVAAVAEVFPTTAHHLRTSHIKQKVSEQLGHIFQKHESLKHSWKRCISESETIKEFETLWSKMIVEFKLNDNMWLQHMYDIRKMWVRAYTNRTFTAHMETIGQNQIVKAVYDCFVNHITSLLEFGTAYDSALQKCHQEEKITDDGDYARKPLLKTRYLMEAQMANIYTSRLFDSFQKELEESHYLVAHLVETEGVLEKYRVKHYFLDEKVRIVVWNKEEEKSHCPCQLFESKGIICRHILSVFKEARILNIPAYHILKRWTLKAKDKMLHSSHIAIGNFLTSPMLRRDILSQYWVYLLNQSTSHYEAYKVVKAGIHETAQVVQKLILKKE